MHRNLDVDADELMDFGARFFDDEEPEDRREGASDMAELWIHDQWAGDDQ